MAKTNPLVDELAKAATRAATDKRVLELEAKVSTLAEQLDFARSRWINLAAPSAASVLRPSTSIKSGGDAAAWWRAAMAQVLEMAEVIPPDPRNVYGHQGNRAVCPLCGLSATRNLSPLETGFAYPSGLEAHLLGSGTFGARQCEISALALERAHHQWQYPDPYPANLPE